MQPLLSSCRGMMSDRFEAGASSLPSGSGPRVSNNGADALETARKKWACPARHLDFAPDAPGLAEVRCYASCRSGGKRASRATFTIKGGVTAIAFKLNFNLKLRIYLEERLAKLQKGGDTDESLHRELFEQSSSSTKRTRRSKSESCCSSRRETQSNRFRGILSSLERSLQTPKIGLHIPFPRNATSTQVKRQNLSKRQRKDTDERPRTLKSLMRAWKRF